MNYALIALLFCSVVTHALAPRIVTQRRNEFAQTLKSATPNTSRAQAIIDELRSVKEERVALELERDLQAFLARTAQEQPTKTEIIPTEPVVVEVPADQAAEVTLLKQQLADKEQEVARLKEEAERAKTESTRARTELEQLHKTTHDAAQRIKQLSLQILDHVNAADAFLGQAQNAAHADERMSKILGNITQQYDAMRNVRDELLNITLPA
jgi:chromosome segregation ATPase